MHVTLKLLCARPSKAHSGHIRSGIVRTSRTRPVCVVRTSSIVRVAVNSIYCCWAFLFLVVPPTVQKQHFHGQNCLFRQQDDKEGIRLCRRELVGSTPRIPAL